MHNFTTTKIVSSTFFVPVKREKLEKNQFHLIGRLPSWDDGILSYHHLFNVKESKNFVQ